MRRRRPAVAALTSLALVLAPLASNAQSSGVHLKDPCEANLLGALDIEDHIYTEGMISPSVPQQLIGFATAPSRKTSSGSSRTRSMRQRVATPTPWPRRGLRRRHDECCSRLWHERRHY